MKISVVLCTYNGERFLPLQLQSYAAQTRLPDELVVCDDCSTDSTPQILHEFAEHAPFPVRLFFNRENLGAGHNFQNAINLARGDVLVWSDQDDEWLINKVERIESEFARVHNVGIVFSNALLVDESSRSIGVDLWSALRFKRWMRQSFVADEKAQILKIMIKCTMTWGMTMAFHARYKTAVLPAKGPCVSVDGWIGTIVPLLARTALIEAPLTKYRQHSAAQVGAPPSLGQNPRAAIRKGFESNQHYYDRKVLPWLALRERLISLTQIRELDTLVQILDGYIAHSRARAALPPSRFKRMPTLVKELVNRNYHTYSSGLRSFTKDLVVPRQATV
jgi:hypothetical protein